MSHKIQDVFKDRMVVIDKAIVDVTGEMYRGIPRFVLDYLLATFVDPTNPNDGLKKVDTFLREHCIESKQREHLKYQIEQLGQYSLFGHVRVRVDQSKGPQVHWVTIPSLGDDKVRIDPDILEKYGTALLVDGAWGKADIVYDPNYAIGRNLIAPYFISHFKPMQVIDIDVDDWIRKREQFSSEEWISILVSTIGFNREALDDDAVKVLLTRLVPFVENAVHLIELGPRETGKTYAYRNLSNYGYIVSGSNITPAILFYNRLRRIPGAIVTKDVICFDEITSSDWKSQRDVLNTLKDVMNSGSFSRGAEFVTNCGVCFVGNIQVDIESKTVAGHHKHLFDGLPESIKTDSAFLDRLHGFIPGWHMGKLTKDLYAKGYGFLADYFAGIMHEMRKRSYMSIVNHHVKLTGATTRSEIAIKRITSGLLKLVYPHRDEMTIKREELEWALKIAVSLRQRVIDQLAVVEAKEFSNVKLGYEWKQ